jgi:hypothetical protein
MLWFKRENPKNEEIEGSLRKLQSCACHFHPSYFDRNSIMASCRSARGKFPRVFSFDLVVANQN